MVAVPVSPLVSVVVPTRNREAFLRGAVTSVLAQSETDIELIVVDDASDDGTALYLKSLSARDNRVRIVRNGTAKGAAGARNEGVSHACGRWIAFLDDDDEWLSTKLELQLKALRDNPSAVACSSYYIMRAWLGLSRIVKVPHHVTLPQLLVNNRMGSTSLCLCSSVVLRAIGGFDVKLESAQDHDLWVRLRQKGDVAVSEQPLVLYRSHSQARITNDMYAQYAGARRFYLKHRSLMDASLRRLRISYNCFIMSRQNTRRLRYRIRYLLLALRHSSAPHSFVYIRSSLPRLVKDAVCKIPWK